MKIEVKKPRPKKDPSPERYGLGLPEMQGGVQRWRDVSRESERYGEINRHRDWEITSTTTYLVLPIHTLAQMPHLNLPMGQSQVVLVVKNLPANTGDIREAASIPEWGRSFGGRHGSPLQYCCLENPMDRGAWQAIVHRATKSWT